MRNAAVQKQAIKGENYWKSGRLQERTGKKQNARKPINKAEYNPKTLGKLEKGSKLAAKPAPFNKAQPPTGQGA